MRWGGALLRTVRRPLLGWAYLFTIMLRYTVVFQGPDLERKSGVSC